MITLTGRVLAVEPVKENGQYKNQDFVIQCEYQDREGKRQETNVKMQASGKTVDIASTLTTGMMVECTYVPSAKQTMAGGWFGFNKCFYIKKIN
jgi:tetrahydromethanopterin S-methyltransferase subunit A